ncbi:MAG: precorrin-3B synthase [Beijerinckiaceae bacterium]|nr:precorrin-3B synthase [Beijerinckiaceae bacterium]MCI0736772.1 precorrin-3B synthase [Beijerinckiaceae bacterium]
MTSESIVRKGWCPGVLRPMPAKDGLLLRLKVSCGVVPAAALRGIAQAGRDHGNGLFDLSARANLQIRGVREDRLPSLIETLDGLGLIDASAAAEAVRNVLVSPLAGLGVRGNAHAAARALEAALTANRNLHALPAKFGFLIDDGSALSLAGVPADVRFDWIGGKQLIAIAIGGTANDAFALGSCEGEEIPEIATRIATAFLRLASQQPEPPRRMRGLIETCGADAIAVPSGLLARPPRWRGTILDPCPIGLLRDHDKICIGVGIPFGRLDADMLDAAASGAEMFGKDEIRLTPWRALIVTHVQAPQAGALSDYFAARGFIVDPGDPRLAVTACGGSSTCEHGTSDARADALALLSALPSRRASGVALQVFGCAKGCGRQAGIPLTLTAHAGLYDLVIDEAKLGRGETGATSLTIAAVREKLDAIVRGAGRQTKLVQP